MIYLNKFQTINQYNDYKRDIINFILPNVSLCVQENKVYCNSFIDYYNGYEYVDLGLPSGTKWAKMNIGATSETEYGNYYMYGKGTSQYNAADSTYEGEEDPLSISVDTVAQIMGGSWHMPTFTQAYELINNTINEWTTINGVNGYKFIGTNGNYIFFPAAGKIDDGVLTNVDIKGFYWCNLPVGKNNAYCLEFYDGRIRASLIYRGFGFPIRGVVD